MIDGQTTVLTVPGVSWGGELELQTKVREDFKIMENAPTGCKWLILLSHLRHYAKWVPKHGKSTWNWDTGRKIITNGQLKNLC